MTLLACAHAAAWAALWRLAPVPAPSPWSLRIVETPAVHLGVRPAAANEGAALTVQLTVRTPW